MLNFDKRVNSGGGEKPVFNATIERGAAYWFLTFLGNEG